jgi:hypothetical protein
VTSIDFNSGRTVILRVESFVSSAYLYFFFLKLPTLLFKINTHINIQDTLHNCNILHICFLSIFISINIIVFYIHIVWKDFLFCIYLRDRYTQKDYYNNKKNSHAIYRIINSQTGLYCLYWCVSVDHTFNYRFVKKKKKKIIVTKVYDRVITISCHPHTMNECLRC